MTNSEIVRNFLEQGGQAQLVAATREFSVTQGKKSTKMLGTYSPVRQPGLGGDRAEAARRSLPRSVRDAAHRPPAGADWRSC